MLRRTAGLAVLIVCLVWGVSVAAGDQAAEIQNMLEGMDERLAHYHAQLQAEGEAELAQLEAEIQSELDEEWEDFVRQIQEEGKAYADWLAEEFGRQILRLKLELLLVSLEEAERGQRLESLADLEETAAGLKAKKEAELQSRLKEFQLGLEERFAQLVDAARTEIEERLAVQYRAFREDMLWAIDHTLRNSLAIRQY